MKEKCKCSCHIREGKTKHIVPCCNNGYVEIKMKYSKNFERDWEWYSKYKDVFTFSGSPNKEIKQGDKYTAKEAFYLYDSQGKIVETTEPVLLQKIFKCKESINFMIKEWAQDRSKGYLPKIEFEKIIKEYTLLPWMVEAVEKQKYKYYGR